MRKLKKLLPLSLVFGALSLSSCSVGGMIYDDVFSTKAQETIDGPRRKLNQPAQQPSQFPSPTMGGMPPQSPGNLPPVQYGTPDSPFYTPPQTAGFDNGSNWASLPPPATLQQQNNPALAAYASGMNPIQQQPPAMIQAPMMQQASMPYQQSFAPIPPPMPMQQMQPQQPAPYGMMPTQQLPPVEYAQPLQPQQQPAPNLPSEQPAFATPQIVQPQQPSLGQAAAGLQAPTYVTQINHDIPPQQIAAPIPLQQPVPISPPPMMQQPYQQPIPQQMASPMPPMQQSPMQQMPQQPPYMQQQVAPQQPAQQKDEKERQPVSSIEGPAEDPIDKLLLPLDDNQLTDKAPDPRSMNSDNYAQPPPNLYDDNYPEDPAGETSQTYEVPIEPVEVEDNSNIPPQSLKAQAATEEMDDILKSPSRNAYTPASKLIDKMQIRGKPASLSSVNSNKDSLNTPLGFDAYGDPIIPDSGTNIPASQQNQPSTQPASQQDRQRIQEIPNPAAKSIGSKNPPSRSIDSLQQRMQDMRL